MKYKRLFALALALCLALTLAACGLEPFREEVRGSGVISSHEIALPGTEVALRLDQILFQFTSRNPKPIDLTVVIDEGLKRTAVLETDNNILTWMRLGYDSARGELTLSAPRTMAFAPTRLKLTVGAPVRALAVDGLWEISYNCPSVKACKLTVDGTADGSFTFGALDSLDMRFSGLSTVSMDCKGVRACKLAVDGTLDGNFAFGEMDSLDMILSGLSTITASGTARRAAIELDGGGDISALGLAAQDASVTISGMGNCEITAEQSLNAVIDGAGSIVYGGSPAVSQRIDGFGSVRAR